MSERMSQGSAFAAAAPLIKTKRSVICAGRRSSSRTLEDTHATPVRSGRIAPLVPTVL